MKSFQRILLTVAGAGSLFHVLGAPIDGQVADAVTGEAIIGASIVYNNKVEMFPSNIFAGLFGYKSKAMFEANADERENVKVEL